MSAAPGDARLNQMHGDGAIGHVRTFRTASVERPYSAVRPGAPAFRNTLIHITRQILARNVLNVTLGGCVEPFACDVQQLSNLT